MDLDKQQRILRALKQAQIMTFISGLHEAQEEMIEELVRRSELKGFPEAQAVIRMIQEMDE